MRNAADCAELTAYVNATLGPLLQTLLGPLQTGSASRRAEVGAESFVQTADGGMVG